MAHGCGLPPIQGQEKATALGDPEADLWAVRTVEVEAWKCSGFRRSGLLMHGSYGRPCFSVAELVVDGFG